MAKKHVGKLAKRYAKALLHAVVTEKGNEGSPTPAQALSSRLTKFAELWDEGSELSSSMLNPMFNRDEREKALLSVADVFELGEDGKRFLQVVFTRDRISVISEIITSFAELADEKAGVISVDVVTARELSGEEKGQVERDLEQKLEGTPVFHWSTDASLIGGLMVRYGGRVLDGSLQGRLQRVERALHNTAIS